MSSAQQWVTQAFEKLAAQSGFTLREQQLQLALTLSDLIEGKTTGVVEAPTGLGKSLAALVPAVVQALLHDKRVVIATYTNVLAEQYWRKDLPLALSLLGLGPDGSPEDGREGGVKPAFLIGRQRYACLIAMDEFAAEKVDAYRKRAELGTETEFRRLVRLPMRESISLWTKVSAPPVCAGRSCPMYEDCYYYEARRKAEKAQIIITNHSVVIQDAIQAVASEDGTGFLGKVDYVVLDEAHDFFAAACGALEYELSSNKLQAMQALATRIEKDLMPAAQASQAGTVWKQTVEDFKRDLEHGKRQLLGFGLQTPRTGILAVAPEEVRDHPGVKQFKVEPDGVNEVTNAVVEACETFTTKARSFLSNWTASRTTQEAARNYLLYIDEFSRGAASLLQPQGVSVSFSAKSFQEHLLRTDTVGVDEPLQDLFWNRIPTLSLSATLALDGGFEFYERLVGVRADHTDILPSPFDYAHHAALYLPKAGVLPDPTQARRDGTEEAYFSALARELTDMIELLQGRVLALFHSRKEMEAVYARMRVHPDLPIYVQPKSGAGTVGDLFKAKRESSLFALRSFWTGFDAPGETLGCVAIVRVPFEVPVDPPTVVRMAHLASQGFDPFQAHTLPMAKMMIRQGAGRLIRREDDRGIIALLDPRLRTKRYGEDILQNLPPDMRQFDDFSEAVAWVGLIDDPD